MIPLNGTVKIRNRKLPIYWTGEFAQHLSERNKEMPVTHPFLHVEAQKWLQICTDFNKKGKSYIGTIVANDKKIIVAFFIRNNFAIIKTCYLYGNY